MDWHTQLRNIKPIMKYKSKLLIGSIKKINKNPINLTSKSLNPSKKLTLPYY